MKIGSHKQIIFELIEVALAKDKELLILDFRSILLQVKHLFKTTDLDFWIEQLTEINIDEIPITKYGLLEARKRLSEMKRLNRRQWLDELNSICEYLFTYCNEEDLCDRQSNYHYYYCKSIEKVFKESRLGASDLQVNGELLSSDIRIAKISELDIDRVDLI